MGGEVRIKMMGYIVLFLLFLFLPSTVNAVGVGVTPSEIEAVVWINEHVDKEITVKNTSDEVGRYSVEADEYKAFFEIYPPEFTLEPDKIQNVVVRIFGRKAEKFGTNLSIIGMPSDQRKFNTGSGVKVPVQVDARGESNTGKYVFGIILVIIVGIASFFVRNIRRRRSLNSKIRI